MVFSSVPAYLDPPSWNQQPSHQPAADHGVMGGGDARQIPSAAAAPRAEGNVQGAAARPVSMAERARLAKVPLPEPALKCPRCDSTNTKFCYFNNYSLSQPRHFCKTCRRYWTRGGALRNVPVGGGCRRNKRSKSGGGSKSSAAASAAADRQTAGSTASTVTSAGGGAISLSIPQLPQLPFMTSLQPLADHYGAAASIALNFAGIQPIDTADFQLGGGSGVVSEQWRLHQAQQFPLLTGLEPVAPPSMGLFPFDVEVAVDGGVGGFAGHVHGKPTASGLITQLAAVKMEENPQALSLPRQYLGIPGSTDQYWSGGSGSGGWTDLSGSFNSSSTSNIL